MNDEPLNQAELGQATSRQVLADAAAAGLMRELRDEWLALGRAVEMEGARFDERAMLASLQEELLPENHRLAHPRQPDSRVAKPARWWPAIVGAALAASLLVALLRSLPVDPAQVVHNQPVEQAAGWDAAIAVSAETGWDDPLDDEIDQAAQQLDSLVAQATGIDASLRGLSQQLESMSDELDQGSL